MTLKGNYYAEVKDEDFEFCVSICANSREGAERVVKREIVKRRGRGGIFYIEGKGKPPQVDLYDLRNMKADAEYWNKRMLLQDNNDGTYMCTDRKNMVCIKFPDWNVAEEDLIVNELYDDTKEYEVAVSRHLAFIYARTFGTVKAKKAIAVRRKPFYKISGVDREFPDIQSVKRYVGEFGNAELHHKLVRRVGSRSNSPVYIVIWDERYGIAQVKEL